MPSINTNQLKEINIKNFINSIKRENLYVSFGKISSWQNDNVPELPIDNYPLLTNFFNDQLYMKRVDEGNATRVARYYKWTPNTRYQQYTENEHIDTLCEPKLYSRATATAVISGGSIIGVTITNNGSGYFSTPTITISGGGGSGATLVPIVSAGYVAQIVVQSGGSGYTSEPTITITHPLEGYGITQNITVNPYYVVTEDLNVFLCLNNANLSLSTVKPTLVDSNLPDSGIPALSDGYVWKYVYTIPQQDAEKFMTPNWIPVKNYNEDDTSLNWQVQYNSYENNRKHGRDIPYSLNASALMLKVRVSGNEGGQIIDSNDYRKISLISNPVANKSVFKAAGGSSTTLILNSSHDLTNNSAVWYPSVGKKIIIIAGPNRGEIREISNLNGTVVTVSEPWLTPITTESTYGILLSSVVSNLTTILPLSSVYGYFVEDEIVQNNSNTAIGKIVYFDPINNYLYLSEVSGTFLTNQTITQGSNNAVISSNPILPDADLNSWCSVLFTENRKKITRYTDQIEDIKIIIQF